MAAKVRVESIKKKNAQKQTLKKIGNPAELKRLIGNRDFNAALTLAQSGVLAAPDSAVANNNLGFVLAQIGRETEGLEYYERAGQLDPNDPETQNSIMRLRFDLKNLTDERVEEFIKRFPRHVKGIVLAAAHYGRAGNHKKSEEYFKLAISIDEKSAEAHYHYGQLLRVMKANIEAMKQFERAYQLAPTELRYLLELTMACSLCSETLQAEIYAQKAIELKPNDFHSYALMGHIFARVNPTKAIEYFDKAVAIDPAAEKISLSFKALALETAGKFEEAEAAFRRAIELDPENAADNYMNMANVLVKQARMPEVMTAVADALRLKPTLSMALNNILLYAHYAPGASRADLWTLFCDFNKKFALPLMPKNLHFPNVKDPQRKLKIGVLSADLRTHSVAFFIEPLLRGHHKEQFEFYAYANNTRSDDYTKLLKQYVEQWRDIFGVADEEVERIIREDQIDILIDLTGHTANNRLTVFARKPAPVQVEWLGFPDTSGLTAIDYRIADEYTDPARFDCYSSEKVVRLPGGFHCYCPFPNAPGVVPLPKIKTGYITFGSFNNYAKTSTEIAAIWVEILNAVPNSKLYLKSHGLNDEAVTRGVRERFHKLGLDPERLIIETRKSSFLEHLMAYNTIDIALDTWPYNGTTTTFEALWMGAPLITLTGETQASRVGASILCNSGLEELIAHSPSEYIEKTLALANNDVERARMRGTMRERMLCSPLLSEKWFVEKFEVALRAMWKEYCGEEGAASNQQKLYAAMPKYEVPPQRIKDLEASYKRIDEMIARAQE